MQRALTVRQPWASLIVLGVKDVENRSWVPQSRQVFNEPVLIHAANRFTVGNHPDWSKAHDPSAEIRGAILGSVRVVDVVEGSESEWALDEYRFHWVLADAVKFAEPIPCPGQYGLWSPPLEVLNLVTAG